MRFILLSLLGLSLAASIAEAKLNVVATTADLGAIAKSVGGDNVELITLCTPRENPHSPTVGADWVEKLTHADVLVEGGAGLESGWLPALLEQSTNSKIAVGASGDISCASGVQLLDVPPAAGRVQGVIHGAGNPHYVIAPSNAKIVARNIAAGLCAIDPKAADAYRANEKKFEDEIDAKLVEWQKTLAPYHGRSLAACHDAWPYFAKEFGLNIDLFLEPQPGVPASSDHLDDIVAKMKVEEARVIVVDSYCNRKLATQVAKQNNAWIVDVAQFPGGMRGTEGGYIPLMDSLIAKIARALSGLN